VTKNSVTIVMVEDDEGHARLIENNKLKLTVIYYKTAEGTGY